MPDKRELLIIIDNQNNTGRVTSQLSHRLSAGASRQGAIILTYPDKLANIQIMLSKYPLDSRLYELFYSSTIHISTFDWIVIHANRVTRMLHIRDIIHYDTFIYTIMYHYIV